MRATAEHPTPRHLEETTMTMTHADPATDQSAQTYAGIYWRLFNAPYSAHASGPTYTRTHLALVANGGYQVAPTTLCGRRHGDNYRLTNGNIGVCKRCQRIANQRGLTEATL